jgi:hypothetical protein
MSTFITGRREASRSSTFSPPAEPVKATPPVRPRSRRTLTAATLASLRPAPATPDDDGAQERAYLAASLLDALRELADAEQATHALEGDASALRVVHQLGYQLTSLRSALWTLGGHLCEAASELTGVSPAASPMAHALALASFEEGASR